MTPPLIEKYEVALELVGQAELPEHVATGRPVEASAGHVGHEQGHLLAFELVAKVEHQANVAGKPAAKKD